MGKYKTRLSFFLKLLKEDIAFRPVDLADTLGVTQSTISNWINGNSLPQISLTKISKALISLDHKSKINEFIINTYINKLSDTYSYDLSEFNNVIKAYVKPENAICEILKILNRDDRNSPINLEVDIHSSMNVKTLEQENECIGKHGTNNIIKTKFDFKKQKIFLSSALILLILLLILTMKILNNDKKIIDNEIPKGQAKEIINKIDSPVMPSTLKFLKPELSVIEGKVDFEWESNIAESKLKDIHHALLQIFDHNNFDENNNCLMIRNEAVRNSYSTELEAGKYGVQISIFDIYNNVLSTGAMAFYVDHNEDIKIPTKPTQLTFTKPFVGDEAKDNMVKIAWNHNLSKDYVSIIDRTYIQVFNHSDNYKMVVNDSMDGLKTEYTTQPLAKGKYGVEVVIRDRKGNDLSKNQTYFYVN